MIAAFLVALPHVSFPAYYVVGALYTAHRHDHSLASCSDDLAIDVSLQQLAQTELVAGAVDRRTVSRYSSSMQRLFDFLPLMLIFSAGSNRFLRALLSLALAGSLGAAGVAAFADINVSRRRFRRTRNFDYDQFSLRLFRCGSESRFYALADQPIVVIAVGIHDDIIVVIEQQEVAALDSGR